MNVIVSLSNTPMAHPPRSNPFRRSSSDAPPFPCITPSTVTCVMVVSFIIAVPFSLGAPLVGGLSPLLRTPPPRSDTASRISFEDFLVRRLQAIRQRDRFGATALTSSCARPVRTSSGDQIDRETLTRRPYMPDGGKRPAGQHRIGRSWHVHPIRTGHVSPGHSRRSGRSLVADEPAA